MGREILFRGKDIGGNWKYGSLIQDKAGDFHISDGQYLLVPNDMQERVYFRHNYVIFETVGQFTGLRDKNGTRIFEGDIIDYENLDGIYTYMVAYDNEYARFAVADDWFGETKIISDFVFYSSSKCIVTGNIHDNPELLK